MSKYTTDKGTCDTRFSVEEREEIAIGPERGESVCPRYCQEAGQKLLPGRQGNQAEHPAFRIGQI